MNRIESICKSYLNKACFLVASLKKNKKKTLQKFPN